MISSLTYIRPSISSPNAPRIKIPWITNAGALGNTAGGTTIAAGATLSLGSITGSVAENLTFSDGNDNGILKNLSGDDNTVSGSVVLNNTTKDSQFEVVGASDKLTVSGAITGSGGLEKTGSGTLLVSSGSSTFSGGTTINAGEIEMTDLNGLGTGDLTINNGTELEANFANASNASLGDITINQGTIRRVITSGTKSGFLNSDTLTVKGTASLIDEGNTAGGFLSLDGPIQVNNGGNLSLTATGADSEVRLGLAADITIAAGGTMQTTGTGEVRFGSGSARTVVGQGTSSSEAKLILGTADTSSTNSGTDIEVNGSGTGGLQITGTSGKINEFLDDETSGAVDDVDRLTSVTGTGGTLTIAHSTTSGSFTIDRGPSAASNVKLGIGSSGSGAGNVTTNVDGTGTGMGNWKGLVIKGDVNNGSRSTIAELTGNMSLTGTSTTFELLDGTFDLNANNFTATGDATLQKGTIDGTTGVLSADNILKTTSSTVTIKGNLAATTTTAFDPGIDIRAGTLLIADSNVIGDTTKMRVTGGTLGFSGDTTESLLGTLTLAANSTFDFSTGGINKISFSASNSEFWSGFGSITLTVDTWGGNIDGGGDDQIFFGSTANGLTAAQLTQIKFRNPVGFGAGLYDARLLSTGELVPVIPEPSTIFGVGLILGLIGWRERRRIGAVFRFFS